MWLAALGAVAAFVTGRLQEEAFEGESKEWLVDLHERWGTATTIVLVTWALLTLWKPARRRAWLVGLVAAALALITGFYGGIVAHGAELSTTRMRPPVTIASPARPGSREPNLAAMPDGRIAMTWFEPQSAERLLLRFATFDGRRWTTPVTIAEGDSFFANWADFPSLRPLGGQRLAAHWLWKSGSGTYAYDVRVSQSDDGGRTWRRPVTPHRDGTQTEHGFVSLVAAESGVLSIWLDGRNSAGHEEGPSETTPDMTLRAAVITREGTLEQEAQIDARVCDCCQTAAVAVWYSAAGETARVHLAFSDDAGATFGAPVRVDGGNPLGRVDVTLLDDGAALVVWLELEGKDALVRARRISRGGRADAAFTVARTSAARASGFPQVARGKDGIVFAWTEAGKPSRIRVARLAPGERPAR